MNDGSSIDLSIMPVQIKYTIKNIKNTCLYISVVYYLYFLQPQGYIIIYFIYSFNKIRQNMFLC